MTVIWDKIMIVDEESHKGGLDDGLGFRVHSSQFTVNGSRLMDREYAQH